MPVLLDWRPRRRAVPIAGMPCHASSSKEGTVGCGTLVQKRFAHVCLEADTMQMFTWQEDLFSVTCYICACMKLHATLLEELDLDLPSWGWIDVTSSST